MKQATNPLRQSKPEGLRRQLDEMVRRVKQVMKQTGARIFGGDTCSEGKLLSVFEPSTEVIRKGKASKANEFGKMVKLQEAENQIVIDFEVYDERPYDSDLLLPAIEIHQSTLGRVPQLVAADAAFYSGKNEAPARAKGVKRVCSPNRSTKSVERRREQKKRWFRRGQKWRTGCESRISVAKRRHGLNRCRYKGENGLKRWVGLGVTSDNLINIGRAMAEKSSNRTEILYREWLARDLAGVPGGTFVFRYIFSVAVDVWIGKTCILRRKVVPVLVLRIHGCDSPS